MDDLKLCPLCNCMVSIINVPAASLCHIECLHCGLKTRTFDSKAGMLEYWNTRPAATTLEAQDAEIARLRAFAADAGSQFAFYAENHRAKGTADGLEKAATNQLWADIARALTGSQSHAN